MFFYVVTCIGRIHRVSGSPATGDSLQSLQRVFHRNIDQFRVLHAQLFADGVSFHHGKFLAIKIGDFFGCVIIAVHHQNIRKIKIGPGKIKIG